MDSTSRAARLCLTPMHGHGMDAARSGSVLTVSSSTIVSVMLLLPTMAALLDALNSTNCRRAE